MAHGLNDLKVLLYCKTKINDSLQLNDTISSVKNLNAFNGLNSENHDIKKLSLKLKFPYILNLQQMLKKGRKF